MNHEAEGTERVSPANAMVGMKKQFHRLAVQETRPGPRTAAAEEIVGRTFVLGASA